MNLAHIHIVLNHIPSIGTAVAVGLFLLSLYRKNDHLKKISLQLLVVMALAVLPTYLTGNAAQLTLRNRTDIPKILIEEHQNSAMIALTLTTILGTLAWFGLWQFRRFQRSGHWNTIAIIIVSVLTSAVILRTANLGGDISHPEIRVVEQTGDGEDIGWRASVEAFANNSWVWPASETLHFLGMTMLFGVALMITLRMLGMMKSVSFAALHRLLPVGILGFVLNVVSGMIFFMASPGMYTTNWGFIWKMGLLVAAGAVVLYFTIFDEPWSIAPDKDAPVMAKIFALSGMALLFGVMWFGRMLPFLRN
jgi:hypothetical protein